MALFFFRTTERAPCCRRYCDLDRLDKYRIIGQPKFGLRSLLSLDCGDRAGKPAEIPVRKLCGCYGGRSRNVVFVIKACGWEGRLFLYGLVRRRSFAWWFPLFCHCLSVHHPPLHVGTVTARGAVGLDGPPESLCYNETSPNSNNS